jgi:hypothetical protein
MTLSLIELKVLLELVYDSDGYNNGDKIENDLAPKLIEEIGLQLPLSSCETCGRDIVDSTQVMYPHGHHGEPVQCLGCYSSAGEREANQ